MTIYQVKPAVSGWANYAIFPNDCQWEDSKPLGQLGTVKARSRSEAIKRAAKHGIGDPSKIWAVEEISDDRITITER